MYRCWLCGAVFEEPDTVRVTENLDGENGWWSREEGLCPRCGAQDFDEFDDEMEDEDDEGNPEDIDEGDGPGGVAGTAA